MGTLSPMVFQLFSQRTSVQWDRRLVVDASHLMVHVQLITQFKILDQRMVSSLQ